MAICQLIVCILYGATAQFCCLQVMMKTMTCNYHKEADNYGDGGDHIDNDHNNNYHDGDEVNNHEDADKLSI